MWPFNKKYQSQPMQVKYDKPRRCAFLDQDMKDGTSVTSIEVVFDADNALGYAYFDDEPLVLIKDGKTTFDNVTWLPVSGWTADELLKAGFADNVPQTVENMLAIAVLRGDKGAALVLADRVMGGEIQWKETTT